MKICSADGGGVQGSPRGDGECRWNSAFWTRAGAAAIIPSRCPHETSANPGRRVMAPRKAKPEVSGDRGHLAGIDLNLARAHGGCPAPGTAVGSTRRR